MHIQHPHRQQQQQQHHKRVDEAVVTDLVDSTAIANTAGATGSLVFDQNGGTVIPNTVTGIPLVVDSSTTLTAVFASPTASPSPSTTDAVPDATPSASSSTSHGPSLVTVVSACIGAFIGAAILIVLAFYCYRSYNRRQEQDMRRRRAARVAEHQQNEKNSNNKPPKSPGPPQIGELAVGEKIDFSQQSPSFHSEFSHAGSAEAELAAKFTASQTNLVLPPSRAVVARADTSYSAQSTSDESFLSLRMSNPVSAPSSVAKMTPLATVSHSYQGESAVVVDPFTDGPTVPAVALTKAPRTTDPFADAHSAKARAMGHRPGGGSEASTGSSTSEQAMQSLIAALELPPAEVEARLRASMQPSVMSDITTGFEDDEVAPESFPLPPSSNGHSRP